MTGSKRVRVAVVFGGRSSEHGVSCLTAREVMAVIDRNRYEVLPVGITPDGQWVEETGEWDDLAPGTLPKVRDDRPAFSWDRLRKEVDVVFPLLHGPWGEDGTIQGLLEMADIPYVGAGVLASAAAMDKPFTKTLFSAAGLPQLPYVTVLPWEWEANPGRAIDRIHALGLPVFVKPARAGSSSGVTMVGDWADLEDAAEAARKLDPKIIVEAAAHAKREVECAVVQDLDGMPIASEVGEIVVDESASHDYYDFSAKYLDGSSRNVIPAPIDPTMRNRIRSYALQAFDAIGCEGLARVDFFLTDSVAGGLVINEINTMPGFTPYSMFPKAWEASGLPYADLVDRLLQLALRRPTGLR
ncbi:D-alanine--D-alanine ligase family protein [uncultured Aeromicrobium sp.]|uniref:D-alanine--D-alanine ligase family protein n=1 Tax=uncultured Aeromicrobium sp. TaxID=337820 RepID=UPI0025F77F17|nr:D-alanine--D-alanine ligase family protein [uncultured Aeromicrobium sp.]